jgi:DNA-binding IscR family transcriptional regulator
MCGERFIDWIGGERRALPPRFGRVEGTKLAERHGISRQFIRRTMRDLELNGFILIHEKTRLGTIYRVSEIENIPCVESVIRVVKTNMENASSVGNNVYFDVNNKASWTTLANVLANVKTKNTQLFLRIYRTVSEIVGQPFGHPLNPTELSTNVFENSTQSNNSPASAGPLPSNPSGIEAGAPEALQNAECGPSALSSAREALETREGRSAAAVEGWNGDFSVPSTPEERTAFFDRIHGIMGTKRRPENVSASFAD